MIIKNLPFNFKLTKYKLFCAYFNLTFYTGTKVKPFQVLNNLIGIKAIDPPKPPPTIA